MFERASWKSALHCTHSFVRSPAAHYIPIATSFVRPLYLHMLHALHTYRIYLHKYDITYTCSRVYLSTYIWYCYTCSFVRSPAAHYIHIVSSFVRILYIHRLHALHTYSLFIYINMMVHTHVHGPRWKKLRTLCRKKRQTRSNFWVGEKREGPTRDR